MAGGSFKATLLRAAVDNVEVTIDLADSATVVSLLLLRRCLRKVGGRYNARVDGFSFTFFVLGVLFVASLNVFFRMGGHGAIGRAAVVAGMGGGANGVSSAVVADCSWALWFCLKI